MGLVEVVAQVVGVVFALVAVTLPVVVGVDRLRTAPGTVRSNLREVAPMVVGLAVVLGLNRLVRDLGTELSWLVGVNITRGIYVLEGTFVADVQSLATPMLTTYFSAVYVFGYVFLLTFPFVAYLVHDEPRALRELLVAYVVNYGIGVLCYVAFVAYGPRNFMPELVDSLLYSGWPQSQLLTGRVNRNTNAFPSLHTSLSVTVALVAYRFRTVYVRWVPLAGLLAASVVASTMYLGIHWAVDVLAGVAVALASVAVAARVTDEPNRE